VIGYLARGPAEGAGVRAGGTALVHAASVVGVDGGDLQPVVGERVVVHAPDRLGGFASGQPDPARRPDVQPVQVKTRQPALPVLGVPQAQRQFAPPFISPDAGEVCAVAGCVRPAPRRARGPAMAGRG
jgi:hypothetical protein